MRLTLRSLLVVGPIITATLASAQGTTCATAAPLSGPGTYSADGPSTGFGYSLTTCGIPGPATHADWYVYTPSFTGLINIRSCGGGVDTRLTVFTGNCGALTCAAYSDDACATIIGMGGFASETDVPVISGVDYYIQWDNRWSSSPFLWTLEECFGTVAGNTYRDQNSNGVFDGGEIEAPVMLNVMPGNMTVNSPGANYMFCSDSGSYTITPTNPPQYHTVVPPSQSYSITAQGQLVGSMDFAFQPIPGIYDGTIDLWGQDAWIGNPSSQYITYCNVGTEPIDGTVQLSLDPDLTFVSSVPAPASSTPNTATWNFTGMMPGVCTTIAVEVLTDSTVTVGDTLSTSATLQLVQSDIELSDNLDHRSLLAVTSLDPNDKAVDLATLTTAEVGAGKALEYTVRFQNTGTMPAVNIVIRDTMDTDLDLGTFEMIGATHPYTLSIVDGTAIWSFQNIMLPDSASNEPGSHGAIHYRVSPKTTLMLGDEVTNRADIYFDFNTPVLTNTVLTVVSDPQSLVEATTTSALQVFPSPTEGLAYIACPTEALTNNTVDVLDASGRVVATFPAQARIGLLPLDLSNLANGHYTVRLLTAAGVRTGKVVLQR